MEQKNNGRFEFMSYNPEKRNHESGKPIAAQDALAWAGNGIAGAQDDDDQIVDAAPDITEIPAHFERALLTLIGQTLERAAHNDDYFTLHFSNGLRLDGTVWRAITREGKRIGPNRHAAIRSRLLAMGPAWRGDEPTDEQLRAYQAETGRIH